MPQISVEYTENIASAADWQSAALEMHAAVETIFGADITTCKSRLIAVQNFVVGTGGGGQGFVHITIAVMPGRSSEQFKTATDAVTALFERALNIAPLPVAVQITCEIRELDGASYNKRVVGPGR